MKLNNNIKALLPALLSFIFSFISLGQKVILDDNFSKTGAENHLVNGLKENKWIEYIEKNGKITTDINAPYYKLTFYNAGKPDGIVRAYYKSGQLEGEATYSDGKETGVAKEYYESGTLKAEVSYIHGQKNGVEKEYYDSLKIKRELRIIAIKKMALRKNIMKTVH
jgi:antitoxin component YwqK of YwqJK toxin-antitoxin module